MASAWIRFTLNSFSNYLVNGLRMWLLKTSHLLYVLVLRNRIKGKNLAVPSIP